MNDRDLEELKQWRNIGERLCCQLAGLDGLRIDCRQGFDRVEKDYRNSVAVTYLRVRALLGDKKAKGYVKSMKLNEV